MKKIEAMIVGFLKRIDIVMMWKIKCLEMLTAPLALFLRGRSRVRPDEQRYSVQESDTTMMP